MYSGMSSETEDTGHWRGHSWLMIWGSDWSQHPNTGLWLAGCYHWTMHCNVLSKHVTTKISPVSGVYLNKMIGFESNGRSGDVIMYGIPLSPRIPSLHHGIQFACELWGNFHTDTGLRVETAPGAVLWLHLNAVISLYAAHYRRQVWSTLTLLPKSFRSFAHKLFCYI